MNYFAFDIILCNDSLKEKNIDNKNKNTLTYPLKKQKLYLQLLFQSYYFLIKIIFYELLF